MASAADRNTDMQARCKERLAIVHDLSYTLEGPASLFQQLEQAGSKACSTLLQRATQHHHDQDWDRCHIVALAAREHAWEQLHR